MNQKNTHTLDMALLEFELKAALLRWDTYKDILRKGRAQDGDN